MNFENGHNSGFRTLRTQLNHIGFQELQNRPYHWLSLIAKATQLHWFLITSETISTLAFVHCESNSISLVFESFRNDLNISFRSLQKQLNYIGFRELKKWPQHWLSFIKKTTQLHWFSKTLKMILTLAFVYCKSNSITLVSHHIYDSSVFFSFLAFMISTKSLNQHHKLLVRFYLPLSPVE